MTGEVNGSEPVRDRACGLSGGGSERARGAHAHAHAHAGASAIRFSTCRGLPGSRNPLAPAGSGRVLTFRRPTRKRCRVAQHGLKRRADPRRALGGAWRLRQRQQQTSAAVQQQAREQPGDRQLGRHSISRRQQAAYRAAGCLSCGCRPDAMQTARRGGGVREARPANLPRPPHTGWRSACRPVRSD